MRLKILDSGYSPAQMLLIRLWRLGGGVLQGPIAVMSYRRKLWGKNASACFQEAMRDMREWSLGEVELFAAFVSQKNACVF